MADKNMHKAKPQTGRNNFLFGNREKHGMPVGIPDESLLANLSEEDKKLIHAKAEAIREHNAWGLIRGLDESYAPALKKTIEIIPTAYLRERTEGYTSEEE